MVELNFKNGIIPVAAQDNKTGEVLMIAFMNEGAFELTLKTGCVHYWSRKNRRVWKKGEVSGHLQRVKQILVDCDNDSLVIKVDQVRAACHTGFRSCFFRTIDGTTIGEKVFDPESVYKARNTTAEPRSKLLQK
ncbi:MAG: phosphoribosyl-AMP cyclohydrolase [Halobacteriota archaeon]